MTRSKIRDYIDTYFGYSIKQQIKFKKRPKQINFQRVIVDRMAYAYWTIIIVRGLNALLHPWPISKIKDLLFFTYYNLDVPI